MRRSQQLRTLERNLIYPDPVGYVGGGGGSPRGALAPLAPVSLPVASVSAPLASVAGMAMRSQMQRACAPHASQP